MNTFRVLATRHDGIAYQCMVLDSVSARCGACRRGRIIREDQRCRVCSATITWDDFPALAIAPPPFRSQHALALAQLIVNLTEMAQLEITEIRESGKFLKADMRERQWRVDVLRACDDMMAEQGYDIKRLLELLVEKESMTVRPMMMLYPQPRAGESFTVTHAPTERCRLDLPHPVEKCGEYGKQTDRPAPIKIPEGPPERWPKHPEWL